MVVGAGRCPLQLAGGAVGRLRCCTYTALGLVVVWVCLERMDQELGQSTAIAAIGQARGGGLPDCSHTRPKRRDVAQLLNFSGYPPASNSWVSVAPSSRQGWRPRSRTPEGNPPPTRTTTWLAGIVRAANRMPEWHSHSLGSVTAAPSGLTTWEAGNTSRRDGLGARRDGTGTRRPFAAIPAGRGRLLGGAGNAPGPAPGRRARVRSASQGNSPTRGARSAARRKPDPVIPAPSPAPSPTASPASPTSGPAITLVRRSAR